MLICYFKINKIEHQKSLQNSENHKAPLTIKNSPVVKKIKARKGSLLQNKSANGKISQKSSIYNLNNQKKTKFETAYKEMANKLNSINIASNTSISGSMANINSNLRHRKDFENYTTVHDRLYSTNTK